MKETYELGLDFARYLWKRPDLESQPADIHRIAEVLRSAGIEVHQVSDKYNTLTCEPRPVAVREALTGQYRKMPENLKSDYPPEVPGQTIQYLKEKGIITDNTDDTITAT